MEVLHGLLFFMIKTAGIFLFLLSAVGFFAFQTKMFDNPYISLCEEVESRIYLPSNELVDWSRKCRERASLVNAFTPRQLIVNDFKRRMSFDGVSHFDLQEPAEANSFWSGETNDHGFEWEYLEQYILITEVAPQSSSAEAGLQRGDLISAYNDKEIHSADLQKNGKFSILRRQKKMDIQLKSKSYQKYYPPQIYSYKGKKVLPLTNFFNPEILTVVDDYIKKLRTSDTLVLDLRQNGGGDFALALSFLNRFICEKKVIGEIKRPKFSDAPQMDFSPNWSQDDQLQFLGKSSSLVMKTSHHDPCFQGPLIVLVSHSTASTGELVAQALKMHRGARVVGEKTLGSLLVGVARPVDILGPGYLLYLPEAIYLDEKGHAIEKNGVVPQIERGYRLKASLTGQDSFLEGL